MQIHQSAEDYLETILMLTQRMGRVRSIDVVNELGFTKASVRPQSGVDHLRAHRAPVLLLRPLPAAAVHE